MTAVKMEVQQFYRTQRCEAIIGAKIPPMLVYVHTAVPFEATKAECTYLYCCK